MNGINMTEPAILILLGLNAVLLIILIILELRPRFENLQHSMKESQRELKEKLTESQTELRYGLVEAQDRFRQELNSGVQNSVSALGRIIGENQQNAAAQQELRLKSFETANEQKLEQIRETMERRIAAMQQDNGERLDEMRRVVDEKLEKTLETRMTESFRMVSERLEEVYKGLGEMQTLASGVGDLKKVLSNVKTRGILGEIQLGAILKEILSPEQYETNVLTKAGGTERVEFAVKLPAGDGECVLLPIDSKFPGDTYSALQDAYENGTPEEIRAAQNLLRQQLRKEAKDIHEKYINPPETTAFAVMFLPFEGLYAEAVNRGMVEELQRDWGVNIAGPSTMAALLNSLQMGFRTVAIQKRSSEVWRVLGAVRTEFDKFEDTLKLSQQHLLRVNEDLDQLIGARSRAISRKLRSVERLESDEAAAAMLDLPTGTRQEDPPADAR